MDFLEFDNQQIERNENSFNFDFIELDDEKKVLGGDKDYVSCEHCGALNNRNNVFCAACQLEIIQFRAMELETKPIKVKLKFSGSDKYLFCPVCGASNQRNFAFCKDCMARLNTEDSE